MLPDYIMYIFVFVFGLCIGSFLNVCIYRLPESRSLVKPRSSCPFCGHIIRYYDNLPVISFLLLGGRCRKCSSSIAFRYPMVELLTGLMALAVYVKFGLNAEAGVYYLFIASLIVVTFIDIDHQIIPNEISLPGIPIFLLASWLIPDLSLMDSLLGIISGGGLLFLVAWFYERLKKVEGMGFGDVKLLAMIGAVVGWKGVLFTIGFSSAVGTLTGLILMTPTAIAAMRATRPESDKTPAISIFFRTIMRAKVPFGPFLAIGAITYLFFGTSIIHWYFRL